MINLAFICKNAKPNIFNIGVLFYNTHIRKQKALHKITALNQTWKVSITQFNAIIKKRDSDIRNVKQCVPSSLYHNIAICRHHRSCLHWVFKYCILFGVNNSL